MVISQVGFENGAWKPHMKPGLGLWPWSLLFEIFIWCLISYLSVNFKELISLKY